MRKRHRRWHCKSAGSRFITLRNKTLALVSLASILWQWVPMAQSGDWTRCLCAGRWLTTRKRKLRCVCQRTDNLYVTVTILMTFPRLEDHFTNCRTPGGHSRIDLHLPFLSERRSTFAEPASTILCINLERRPQVKQHAKSATGSLSDCLLYRRTETKKPTLNDRWRKQMLSKLLFTTMIGSSRKNTNHYNRALTETNLGPCQIDRDHARVLSNWMKLSSFNLTRFQLGLSQFDRTLIQFDKGRLWSLSIWQRSLYQLHRTCAIKKVHGMFLMTGF